MILTRLVRGQLVVLLVASVLATAVLGLVYVRVPSLLGIGEYTVSAQFTEAARLYDGAEVTVRGRAVGRVSDVRLGDVGVEAVLEISDDVELPTGVRARVRSLSAVGEQYVDLVPDSTGGPVLADGGVIPLAQTSVPLQIGPVLDQVHALVMALPAEDLNVLVDESHDAVEGTGDDLARLIDSGDRLLELAAADYEPTEQLIRDLEPVLGTQNDLGPELRSLAEDLAAVTAQLRSSDGDLRGLLTDGRPFARELTGLLDDLGPTLPVLLGNLVTVGDVLATYHPNLETILVAYPALVNAGQTLSLPVIDDARVQVDLDAALNDPPPCLTGFVPAEEWRDPSDTTVGPRFDAYCRLPADDVTSVRGARNTPCMEGDVRRAATPAECRGEGTPVLGGGSPLPGAPGTDLPAGLTPRVVAVPYDPLSGRAIGPDGRPFYLRNFTQGAAPGEDATWQDLMLGPVGRS